MEGWRRSHGRESSKQRADVRIHTGVRAAKAMEAAVKLGRAGRNLNSCSRAARIRRAEETAARDVDDEAVVAEEVRAKDWLLDVGKQKGVMHFETTKREGKGL